jgi:hypothetical protein
MLSHTEPQGRSRTVAARVLVVSVLVAASVALVPQPASASCAELPDLETAFAEAEVVFIGVVVDLTNNDRTAVMEVEEVWKGPQLPGVVTVNGGPTDASMFTSVDRTFGVGTYIVFPVNSAPPFEDNACTLTQRTTAALDVINPFADEPLVDPSAETVVTTIVASGESATPEPVSVTSGSGRVPILVTGIGFVALGIGAFAWRRRSSRGS